MPVVSVRNVTVVQEEPSAWEFECIGRKYIRDTSAAVCLGWWGTSIWIPKANLVIYDGKYYAAQWWMKKAGHSFTNNGIFNHDADDTGPAGPTLDPDSVYPRILS